MSYIQSVVSAIRSAVSTPMVTVGNYRTTKPKTQDAGQAAPAAGSDRVSISNEAYALSQAGDEANTSGASATSGRLDLALDAFAQRQTYLLNNLEEVTEDFQKELKWKLKQEGINVSEPFELTTAGDGSVVVKGDHPDKARIERYFKDNLDMRDRFVEIGSATVFKKHIELHLQFVKEYQKDPEAAVAKYFPLFDMIKREGFSMSLGGGSGDASQAA
jgi:hypothetical protein